MATVWVGVGTNLGDRDRNIESARKLIQDQRGVIFHKAASIYTTEPVGGPPQDPYLNTVWEIETKLSPHELLSILLSIETTLGRKRSIKNAPRIIDLDILLYSDFIINDPNLTVPHPRLHERWFALKPLADLAPDFIHPKLGKRISELLKQIEKSGKDL